MRDVGDLRHDELVFEKPIPEIGAVIFLTVVYIAFPFAFYSNGIVGQVYNFDTNQIGNFILQEREVAFDENNIGRLDLDRYAIWLQVATQIVAGSGVYSVVAGDTDPFTAGDVFQAVLEKFEVNSSFAF